MKKIVMATATVAMLSSLAMASESFFDYKKEIGIGYEYQSANIGENQQGIAINAKGLKTIATVNGGQKIAVGLTLNGTYIPSVDYATSGVDADDWFIDILPTVTYEITSKIDVSAMLGYTFGERDSNFGTFDWSGVTYGLGASYELAPQWRVNAELKFSDLEIQGGGAKADQELTRYVIGIGYNF